MDEKVAVQKDVIKLHQHGHQAAKGVRDHTRKIPMKIICDASHK